MSSGEQEVMESPGGRPEVMALVSVFTHGPSRDVVRSNLVD